MRSTVIVWICILGVLLAYELWTAFDGDPGTMPLTHVVMEWVPWYLGMPIPIWLVYHFGIRYWRKRHDGETGNIKS